MKSVLDFQDLLPFVKMDRVEREVDKLNTIEFDITLFESIYKDSDLMKRHF